MTNPRRIDETEVNDGRGGTKTVKPGDSVELLPVDIRIAEGDEDADYFAQEEFDSLQEWLGRGPYPISWIGEWPCGRIMLYLNTSGGNNSGGPGAYAADFKATQ